MILIEYRINREIVGEKVFGRVFHAGFEQEWQR